MFVIYLLELSGNLHNYVVYIVLNVLNTNTQPILVYTIVHVLKKGNILQPLYKVKQTIHM